MTRLFSFCTAASLLAGTALHAAPPQVVTDIAPVHGLVSDVMGDLGAPVLILTPGASPHGHALRPSEAAAIAQADMAIWIGHLIAPWLEDALETLAPDAASLELLSVPGITLHEFREGPIFEEHDHDAHADHAEHAEHAKHEEHAEHDDHAQEDPDHGHSHEGIDPHAWLDPVNGQIWLTAIAEALAATDPDNADTYRANADRAKAELVDLSARIYGALTPSRGKPFVIFHDAYHGFEARFEIEAKGALRKSDATDPGPARVAEIRDLIVNEGIVCLFREPQFPDRKIAALIEGTDARIGTLDPLGRDLPLGQGFYPALINSVATGLMDCLAAD